MAEIAREGGCKVNPTRMRRLTRQAYHEAGHAILGAVVSDTPRLVTIRGRVPHCTQVTCLDSPYNVQVLLAGTASEHLFHRRGLFTRQQWCTVEARLNLVRLVELSRGTIPDDFRNDDFCKAVQMTRAMGAKTWDDVETEIMRLYAVTRDSLRAVAPTVEALVATLLERRQIDRDDVFEFIEKHPSMYDRVWAVQESYGIPTEFKRLFGLECAA